MTAVEAEWAAALVDAGIAGAAANLYTFPPGSDLGGGRQAAYSAPGDFVLPPPEQAFLEALNREPDLHRVAIADGLEPHIAAAVIRHELEHARQFSRFGRGMFRLQDLITAACWRTTGRSTTGGGFLINAIPPEFDANAAAARFAWSRHPIAVESYMAAPDAGHQVLFRYESGPGPLETLPWRTLAYAAVLADACEQTALQQAGKTFRDYIAEHLPGHAELWDRLRPQPAWSSS